MITSGSISALIINDRLEVDVPLVVVLARLGSKSKLLLDGVDVDDMDDNDDDVVVTDERDGKVGAAILGTANGEVAGGGRGRIRLVVVLDNDEDDDDDCWWLE